MHSQTLPVRLHEVNAVSLKEALGYGVESRNYDPQIYSTTALIEVNTS